jgi:hypothetical protein
MCTFKIFGKVSADFRHSKAILTIIGIALFSLSPAISQAQEVLRGLSVNPELIKESKEKKVKQLKADGPPPEMLTLPFVDDFSTTKVYPDQSLWVDKQAYINTTYAVDPPTIGVATLDALDENGYIYQNASSNPFYADKLTSKPFILDTTKIDSQLYLSFFYQPQGLGYKPLPEDSLVVEFYKPNTAKWIKVWATPGGPLKEFKQKTLQVSPEFQKKGFQFRFRNIASLQKAMNEPPGTRGNVAQWNIDYVRLNTGRNEYDTIINDMAFVKPITSLLKYYESMPWHHYKIARVTGLKPTIDITYRSLGNLHSLIRRSFKITELRSDNLGTVTNMDMDFADLLEGQTLNFKANFGGFEPFDESNASNFEIKGYLGNTSNDIRHENDTVRYIQVFSNYFAYDDGSSEYGYGLNAANDMAAYSFYAYRPDTLTAVGFYFNQTEHDTTLKYSFKLAVWDDKDNHPGNLIYSKSESPQKVKLNQIWNFKLDSGILVNEKFYVGFIQESADFLNIGFDRNNDNHSFLSINSGGLWKTSEKAGSLMIRPVLGSNFQEGPVAVKPIISKQSFGVYPNPADNQLFINTGDYKSSKPLLVDVYNITGKLVLSTQLYENTLDVSSLANGLYFLKLTGDNLNSQPIKLLIQR